MACSRRDVLKLGAGAGAALFLGQDLSASGIRWPQESQLLKTIPSSGERVPAVGLGTASSFSQAARTPEDHTELLEVVRRFTDLGGAFIDTSPSYGASEEVMGRLIREAGNAEKVFMATKVSRATGREEGMAQIERSEERMRPGNIDLNQVHNLGDWVTQLPLLREMKQAGRIRYVGITTSSDRQYEDLAQILRTEEMDFVQFDYAVDNRNAEETLLPIARDRGLAVICNLPFGRTRLWSRIGDRDVPEWGAEFGANSWAQFFLKWLLGNPDVTFVIPATSDPGHLVDNMGAGLGRLPTQEERTRMAEVVDALPPAPRRRR